MTWIRDILDPRWRSWEEMYRNRWEHDSETRSTHGVNCTGGCSWIVYAKEGIVTWEMQATDYPALAPGLPQHEPRGCQRGISFSWHVYAPTRVKHPYLRGALADLWARARAQHADPVDAWASIVEDEGSRRTYQQARGKGGLRRATWEEALELVAASLLYTAKRYGPDRVAGFSPIPAMSMVSYAAGSRFLQLFGGALLSFYDLYADFPPASPETWGEKTDVAESADWFNSKYLVVMGSNLDMTRTPDAHYAVEARNHGAKLVVLSPDFSQVAKHADWWLPVAPGMDGALFLAATHVILQEFHAAREVPYFTDYLRRFSDAPFLVQLEPQGVGGAHAPGRLLRASDVARTRDEEHADWKPLVLDRTSGEPRMPQGSIGFRWQAQEGRWNLDPRDGQDGSPIDPALTLLEGREAVLQVAFAQPGGTRTWLRGVPVRYVETLRGRVAVTTTLDLLMAHYGVARGLEGEWPSGYDDEEAPYTPAWQERYTGIGRNTVIQLAREWAGTAERTRGKCTVIIGSGVNHWYHANLHYRAAIAPLVLCGCVGVNGGGLAHYTGQEKLAPTASWVNLAMALDWGAPPRLQNGPSFHYVHTDQWRYERELPDVLPAGGRFASRHTLDHQVDAVRRGWLPFCPHFGENPIEIVREAERAGARSEAEIAAHVAERLRTRALRFAVEDPDAPENWPRVWLVWRANALLSSAKGHEFFLRHYLGLEGNAVAQEAADDVREATVRHPAPRGKLDLLVDVNFRMDTTALYSDVVLPAASWYEKNDLNTTDLHSYIHPLGAAVPPCWESRTDWDTFKALAEKVSALAPRHFPAPFRDLVATALAHDTPDELAQPEVRDWFRGECDAVPGRTLPHLGVVERDYRELHRRFCALGPRLREHGVEDRGVHIPVADLYDDYLRKAPTVERDGVRMPSLERDTEVANVILQFAPETNGEVAWRGFRVQERRVGRPLADLAEPYRGVAHDFLSVTKQPRRILTSPCWSGITNAGRAYSAFTINVERLVPWRTLTGRQHLYLDHEAYRAFGEHLPVFKPRIDAATAGALARSATAGAPAITLNCITPHGKWHMHTTYYDNLRMLTLSRGVEPFWLNDRDAAEIGVVDNDWVEAFNDSGVVVTRAAVSARIPRGLSIFYHAPERTISFPKSPLRGRKRGGGHNSLTRMRLKPVLMVGGYAQHCYRFNDYGPPASDRDTWIMVRKLAGAPQFY